MQPHQLFTRDRLRQRLVEVNKLRLVLFLKLEELCAVESVQLNFRKIASGRAGELENDLDRVYCRIAVLILQVHVLLADHVSKPTDRVQECV